MSGLKLCCDITTTVCYPIFCRPNCQCCTQLNIYHVMQGDIGKGYAVRRYKRSNLQKALTAFSTTLQITKHDLNRWKCTRGASFVKSSSLSSSKYHKCSGVTKPPVSSETLRRAKSRLGTLRQKRSGKSTHEFSGVLHQNGPWPVSALGASNWSFSAAFPESTLVFCRDRTPMQGASNCHYGHIARMAITGG